MLVCAHTKHVPCPRSHLAASALWRVSFHSSSDTWSLLGTRLRRKWNCGHQSARSSQNIFNSLVSWAAQNWVRAAASFFQAVTQNWYAAWSSLTKSAPKISTSPFDWSGKKQSTKKPIQMDCCLTMHQYNQRKEYHTSGPLKSQQWELIIQNLTTVRESNLDWNVLIV